MEFTPHSSTDQANKYWSSWPNLILWILCSIPLLHAVIIASLGNVQSGQATLVHQLRPIGTLGAAAMLFYVASQSAGRHRWSWTFFGTAILLGSLFSFLRINQNISVATPLLRVLVILIYVCGLIGTALYLQQRTWWLGSTWRVIIGSIAIGMGVLVLMRTVLPLIFPAWPWNPYIDSTLSFLAFDTGMLFALSLITIRYGHEHSRLLRFVVLGLVCLLVADTLFMLLSWIPGGAQLQTAVLPLYTLHAVLLAFGAYHDVTHISTRSKSIPTTMPLIEWLLWVLVPLVVTVAAFTTASIFGTASPALMIALALITITNEVLAMFDYQRITVALHKARLEAADAAAMRERARLARDFHDSLGAHLSGLNADLRAAKAVLKNDPIRASESIADAQRIVKEAVADVRILTDVLRNGPITSQPLFDLLNRLIERNRAARIETELSVLGTPYELNSSVNETLYRIVQEGLTNMRKHAQANRAIVQIDYRNPDRIGLSVEDNGHGTDHPHGGFGLMGIRERVEQISGTFEITTAPGCGLRLEIEVPV